MRILTTASGVLTTTTAHRGFVSLRSRLALVSILVTACPLALTTTQALAREIYTQSSTINTPSPAKLAIDQSEGLVYSFDVSTGSITKYDIATGEPVDFSALGSPVINGVGEGDPLGSADQTPQNGIVAQGDDDIAVDNSGGPAEGNIYVADVVNEGGLVEAFNSAGDYLYELNGTEVFVPHFGNPCGVAVDGSGDLYVSGFAAQDVFKYTTTATSATPDPTQSQIALGSGSCHIAVTPAGDLYAVTHWGPGDVTRFDAASGYASPEAVNPGPAYATAVDPASDDLYVALGNQVGQYDPSNHLVSTFGATDLSGAHGLAVQASTNTILVADEPSQAIHLFAPVTVPDVTTTTPSALEPTSATLEGHVDPLDAGEITGCRFEYGNDTSYGHTAPCETTPTSTLPYPAATDVHADISGLAPGHTYHYRLDAANANGTNEGPDQTFKTPQAPSVEAFYTSNLTETTAELKAAINPNGADTTYHFEYGVTTGYGHNAPMPDEDIGSSNSGQHVTVTVTGLEANVTYHFRVVATNEWGTTTTEDQSFNFNPPNCPNAHVRQQTDGEYLPDCRAYELVSPADANGAIMFPDIPGPNSPFADDHYAFGAAFSTIPGTGEPINGINVDRYVATRTPEGWVSKYVGVAGDQTAYDETPVTDLAMDKFLSYDEGQFVFNLFRGHQHEGSSAPYVYNNKGAFIERWPTNLASIPGGEEFYAGDSGEQRVIGAKRPSPDFSHYFFSSSKVDFAPPNGVMAAPGSVYDNNIGAGTVTIASRTQSGGPIPQGAGEPTETIQLPAVSNDGTHVLMSTQAGNGGVKLYMRVNEAVSYDVSQEHGVQFVGMTSDGSKVYFTSEEQLTSEDDDTSTDLYMWSEASNALTLVSTGTDGAGNTDDCEASWTSKCDIQTIETAGADFQGTQDSSIASQSGDIFFYSPEQLDGAKGIQTGRISMTIARAVLNM